MITLPPVRCVSDRLADRGYETLTVSEHSYTRHQQFISGGRLAINRLAPAIRRILPAVQGRAMIEHMSMIAEQYDDASCVPCLTKERPKHWHLIQTPSNCELLGPFERVIHHVDNCGDDFTVWVTNLQSRSFGQIAATGADLILVE